MNKLLIRPPRSSKSQEIMRQSVRHETDFSVHKITRFPNVLKSSLHCMMRKDLCRHSYMTQLVVESDQVHPLLNGHVKK